MSFMFNVPLLAKQRRRWNTEVEWNRSTDLRLIDIFVQVVTPQLESAHILCVRTVVSSSGTNRHRQTKNPDKTPMKSASAGVSVKPIKKSSVCSHIAARYTMYQLAIPHPILDFPCKKKPCTCNHSDDPYTMSFIASKSSVNFATVIIHIRISKVACVLYRRKAKLLH